MRFSGLTSSSVASLLCCLIGNGCKGGDKKTDSPHRVRAVVINKKLSTFGYKIDLEKLKFETLGAEQAKADLAQQFSLQSDVIWRAQYLLQYLTLEEPPVSFESFQQQSAINASNTFLAYYHPERHSLVFLESDYAGPGADDGLVAHELIHAYQSRVLGGLGNFLRNSESLDDLFVRRIVIEGHAEAVSSAVVRAGEDHDLQTVALVDDTDSIEQVFSGEALSLIYRAGRRFFWLMHADGGWELVEEVLQSRPTSSEQMLHPSKLGQDMPTTIDLPPWPSAAGQAKRQFETVVGEFAIYGMLINNGLRVTEAYISATGWDGDLMRVYQVGNDEWVMVWRTLWDRNEDAKQFVEAFSAKKSDTSRLRLRQKGCAVDLVYAKDQAIAPLLHAVLNTAECPADTTTDVLSTISEEQRALTKLKDEPKVRSNRWLIPRVGLSIAVPLGWKEMTNNGRASLVAPASAAFSANLNVIDLPRNGQSLEDLLKSETAPVKNIDSLTLDHSIIGTTNGISTLRIEFHGTMPGMSSAMHFIVTEYLCTDRYVVITATGLYSHRKEDSPILEAAIASLEIDKELCNPL
ncbi:MAG: hypothetical protein JKY56_19430 [Kofleriaceae bacterium]|nr:hypothetical protein [Kofleriaceae bacterium]